MSGENDDFGAPEPVPEFGAPEPVEEFGAPEPVAQTSAPKPAEYTYTSELSQLVQDGANKWEPSRRERDNQALRIAFDENATKGLTEQAKVLRLTRLTGRPSAELEANLKGYEAAWEAAGRDPEKLDPHLRQAFLEDPRAAGVYEKDKPFSKAYFLFKKAGTDVLKAFTSPGFGLFEPFEFEADKRTALAQMEKEKNAKELVTDDAEAKAIRDAGELAGAWERVREQEARSEIADLRTKLRNLRTGQEAADDLLSNLTGGMFRTPHESEYELEKQIADKENAIRHRDVGDGILADAATGIASSAEGMVQGAKAAGPAAAAAGVGALAVTRNPKVAWEVAKKVGGAAFGAGVAEHTFNQAGGQAYGRMLDEGLPEPVARGASYLEGAGNAVIEVGLGVEALAVRDAVKKALRKELLTPAGKQLGKRLMKAYGSAVAGEVGEEGLQSADSNLVDYLARSYEAGKFLEGEIIDRGAAFDAMVQALPSSLALGIIGPAVQLTREARQLDRSRVAGKQIAALAQLPETELARAAPELVAKTVESATSETGAPITSLFVDTKAFLKLFQSEAPQAAEELLGPDGPKQLKEAIDTGGRLEVPVATYLEKWGSNEAAKQLAPDTAASPVHMTPRELEAFDQVVLEAHAKAIEKENTQEAAAELEQANQLVDQLEDQLKATKLFSAEQARTAMKPFRAAVETNPALVKNWIGGVFSGLDETKGPRLTLNQDEAPSAIDSELAARLDDASQPVDQAQAALIDDVTGLRSRRAFESEQVPEGMQVAAVTSTDVKPINDSEAGGHDTANEVLRAMGLALGEHPEAARAGTTFFFHAKDQAEVDKVIAAMRQQLPGSEVTLEGSLGADMKAAGGALNERVDLGRAAGALPARGEATQGLDVAALKPNAGRAKGAAPAAAAEKYSKMEKGQFANEVLKTPSGLLSREGRDLLPRKKHTVAIDLKGVRATNDEYGTAAGDAVIAAFEAELIKGGGKDFRGARLGGDEYELQHDDLGKLEDLVAWLEHELKRVKVRVEKAGSTDVVSLPVGFRHGFGPDYAAADRDLNRRKKAEGTEGPDAGDQRGRQDGVGRHERALAEQRGNRGEDQQGAGREAGKVGFKQGERGASEFFAQGSQRVFKLILNKGADVSTVLHESAHIFLEMMRVAAEDPDASQRTKQVWADARKALGAGEQLTVEQHEKFARGFERYLMEGHAPSAALVGVFQRFKLWLKKIYRTASSLNVELNPELRSVFDRLLATDREIFAQQQRMGLLPMYRDPAEAGMTPEQWTAYLEVQEDAAAHVQRAAELRALKDRLRHTERWWKDDEKQRIVDAETVWENLPARRAELALKGKLGEAQTSAVRLDKATVEKVLGKEAAKKIPTKKDGANPDDIASQLTGYPTGEAMLKAIAELPEKKTWAKEQAAAQMAEAHPDVLEEKTELQALVQKGLHGDFTAQWLLKEFAALRARGSKKNPLQTWPPVEAIRLAAQKMVANAFVGRLSPGKALNDERAAASKATKAAAAGDFAQAAVFKQQQLLNFYLWRELTEAKEFRDGFLERANDATKDKARAKLGKAHALYRDGADLVLETFGLKEAEQREEPLPDLRAVVDRMVADAQTVGFDEQLVGQLLDNPKPWKQLTVTELKAVDGALRNIQNAAREQATVLLDGKAADFEDVKQQLLDEADAAAPNLPAMGASVAGEGRWRALKSWVAGLDGEALKPETMLSWLGNRTRKERLAEGHNSVWYRAIVKELQHAKAREVDLIRGPAGKMLSALEALGKADRKSFTASFDGAKHFPGWKVKSGQDVAAPGKRYELLMLALNYGNESNAQRIRDGYNVTDEQVRAALDLLTERELAAVQAVWDANEKLRPLAFDLEEQETGLRPKAIPARALKLKGGELRGGYHPLVYDARFEKTGQRQEAQALADLMDPTFTRPGTSHGHLKSRVDTFVGAVSLDPNRIATHVMQAAHDIAFRRAVKSAGKLLLDEDVQAKLKSKLGKERSDLFVPWLRDIGQQRGMAAVVTAGKWNKAAQILNAGQTHAVLGYSLKNAVEDLTNLPLALAVTDLKPQHLTAALLEAVSGRSDFISEARGLSGELRTRQDQLQRELGKAIADLTTESRLERGFDLYKHHAFVFMETSDKLTSTVVWMGRYRQALVEGNSQTEAIERADAALRKVYAGHSAVDRAALLRDKGWAGTVLRFYSFLNQNWNVVRDLLHDFHTAEDNVERGKLVVTTGARLLAMTFITGAMSELLRGRGPEEGEPPEEWLLRKMVLGGLSYVPFGGEAAQLIEAGILGKPANPRAGQLAGLGLDMYRAYQALASEKAGGPEKFEKTLNAFGRMTGLPQTPVRQASYLYELASGDREPGTFGETLKGVAYGAPPKRR